jgi:hypothetical protein
VRAWPSLAYLLGHVRPATANANGPAHRRVRAAVWHPEHPASLHPARTEGNYGELVTEIAGEMADDLITHAIAGPTDLAAGFAAPMAARVISSVLGLPEETTGQVRAWADAQASLLGQDLRGRSLAAALTALAALARACRDLTGARLGDALQDLASLAAPSEGALTAPLAVPLENRIRLVTCRSSARQAARAYSLISPPKTGFRRIRSLSRSVTVARGAPGSSSGTRWEMPWCGRAVL